MCRSGSVTSSSSHDVGGEGAHCIFSHPPVWTRIFRHSARTRDGGGRAEVDYTPIRSLHHDRESNIIQNKHPQQQPASCKQVPVQSQCNFDDACQPCQIVLRSPVLTSNRRDIASSDAPSVNGGGNHASATDGLNDGDHHRNGQHDSDKTIFHYTSYDTHEFHLSSVNKLANGMSMFYRSIKNVFSLCHFGQSRIRCTVRCTLD